MLVLGLGLDLHLYVDDTRVVFVVRLRSRTCSCIDDVEKWMRFNRLQINTAKTEIM